MDSGVLFHALCVAIANSQRHKKRILIVIHFSISHSFSYNRLAQHTARESFLNMPVTSFWDTRGDEEFSERDPNFLNYAQ